MVASTGRNAGERHSPLSETRMINRTKLTKAFIAVRKLGIVAKQDFLCCDGCANVQLDTDWKDGKFAGKRGYIFYHNQDTTTLVEQGRLHLGFGTFDDNSKQAVALMREVRTVFRQHGFKVSWNGRISQKPEIS